MSVEPDSERVVRTVDELKTLIGQEISVGDWVELTQEMVDRFVSSTTDSQSGSTPAESTAAEPTRTVVPGYFLLSAGSIIGSGRRGVTVDLGGKLSVNYGMNEVRFPTPVYVGQRVRSRSSLVSVEQISERAVQMARRQTIEIEGESEPACVAETLGRVYFS